MAFIACKIKAQKREVYVVDYMETCCRKSVDYGEVLCCIVAVRDGDQTIRLVGFTYNRDYVVKREMGYDL